MLRALAERDIVPDVVLGCSVGALNGAGYAADPTVDGVARLEEHWRSTTSHTLMPSSRIPSAVQLLRKGESLHSQRGAPLRARGRCSVPSHASRTSCCPSSASRPTSSTPSSAGSTRAIWSKPILASAALPARLPPVVIDGRRYIDGGVIDNVPIARAVELGCRTIYVLHVGLHGRPDAEIKRPLDGALLAYWIARNSRFARDLAAPARQGRGDRAAAGATTRHQVRRLRPDRRAGGAGLRELRRASSTSAHVEAAERRRGAELLRTDRTARAVDALALVAPGRTGGGVTRRSDRDRWARGGTRRRGPGRGHDPAGGRRCPRTAPTPDDVVPASDHGHEHTPGSGPDGRTVSWPDVRLADQPLAVRPARDRARPRSPPRPEHRSLRHWQRPEAERRDAVAAVVADWPRFLDGWARLGSARSRRRRALRLLPRRLPPWARHAARVGLAWQRLRALAPRVEPRLPASARRPACRRRGDRRGRRGGALPALPAPVRPGVATTVAMSTPSA